MGIKVQFKSRTPYDGLSVLCCWTYEVSRDDGQVWEAGETIAIGLDERTDVENPLKYADCNDYMVNPDRGKPRASDIEVPILYRLGRNRIFVSVTVPAETDMVTISFIAPCRAFTRAVVEFYELGVFSGEGDFLKRDVDGGDLTTGPDVFFAARQPDDSLGFIARYEGMKFGHMLAVLGASPAAPAGRIDPAVGVTDRAGSGGCGCEG